MDLSYKQAYPVKGDSIVIEVEGWGPQRIRVRAPDKGKDSHSKMAGGTFDHEGLTRWAFQEMDSWGYPDREKPWRIHGEPEESRRSKAAKRRFVMTEAQRAELDAHVLYVLTSLGADGESTAGLAADCFRNHSLTGTDRWVDEATDHGARKKENALVGRSLARMEREGRVTRQDWRFKDRGRYVNPWVAIEFKDQDPRWRREVTGYWPHGTD